MSDLLTLDEARLHLRVDRVVEDDLIEGAIEAAQEWIEDYTVLVLTRRTVTEQLDRFSSRIGLRAWPVVSITSVNYVDGAGASQSLASSTWLLSNGARPARLLPVANAWWARPCAGGPVTITFVAGFASPDDVPRVAIQALKLLVSHFYTNRSAVIAGQQAAAVEVPFTAKDLLRKWRRRIL